MKRIFNLFLPTDGLRFAFLIIIGIIIGFGIFTFHISKAASYLNEKPETCINCHVMNSLYASWSHSSHRERTNCVDCHMPHDNIVNKYWVKSRDGMKDVYKFTFRMERDVPRATDESRKIIQENCVRCHKSMIKSVNPIMTGIMMDTEWNGTQCWDCHRQIPHTRVRGLATAPNAEIMKKNKPVPNWLEKKLVFNNREK